MSKLTKAVFERNYILKGENYIIDLNTRNLVSIKNIDQYCRVDKIQEMILEQNSLSQIEEVFRHMILLKLLELQLNQIQIIENLELPNLEQLNLNTNFIKEVPQLQLPRLKVLNLSFNKITYIADQNLPSLEQLNLAGNQLIYLPKLNQSPRLRILDVQKNNLISITRLMGTCQYLQDLKMGYNQVPGEYIDELCAVIQTLPSLDKIDFKGNPVSQINGYEIRLLKAKPGLKYIDNIHLSENIIQNLQNMEKTKSFNELVELTKEQYYKWIQEREEVRRVMQKQLNQQKLRLDFQFEDKEEDNIEEMKEFFDFIKEIEAKKKRGEKLNMDDQNIQLWRQRLLQSENQRIQAQQLVRQQQIKNNEQQINNYVSTKTMMQKLFEIAINEPEMWKEIKRKELVQIPQEQSDEPSSGMRSMNSIETPQESGSRSGNYSVRSGKSRF
ncbi:unnamed protein product [Paramecium primaurelia]|uniref:Leucine-rich repeat protein n=1 Tax=Paramecium primaurelia TaxID=5886 RepID=A0A8S1KRS0_PARPR|nr:unnamed protein product [Paramecium primaurelia]